MSRLLVLAIFLGFYNLAYAAEEYRPIFEFKLEVVTENKLLSDYKIAAKSINVEQAIKNWESFFDKHVYDNAENLEDLTELVYLRQAHFELAKLYYLNNNIEKADELVKKGSDYVIYSQPENDKGVQWCRVHKYCQ